MFSYELALFNHTNVYQLDEGVHRKRASTIASCDGFFEVAMVIRIYFVLKSSLTKIAISNYIGFFSIDFFKHEWTSY